MQLLVEERRKKKEERGKKKEERGKKKEEKLVGLKRTKSHYAE